MITVDRVSVLRSLVEALYSAHEQDLPFHGWHHIKFVAKKSVYFGATISANLFIVESSALVHDLNYLVKVNSNAEAGAILRRQILSEADYIPTEIERIEKVVLESSTVNRGREISNEGKSLSDADTLFKALPITPVIFSAKYLSENRISLLKLAKKITEEQVKLMDEGIYFYTDIANEHYLQWGKVNLNLWRALIDAIEDQDVQELVISAHISV